MEFDIYEAPEGYAYLKDDEYSLTVLVPKGSNIIDEYSLVKME